MKKFFAEITKRDDEQRMVYGYASTEAMDRQGEQVTKAAMEAALPEYLEFSNIREMHQPSAVGVAKSAGMDDKGLYISAKIVDDSAWRKVREGVYKGFSIGGKALKKTGSIIEEMRLTEISLVDRPANPEAVIEMFKRDGSEPDPSPEDFEELLKRSFTDDQRKEMAGKGEAMPDGSFPIATVGDLKNAIRAIGRAKDEAKAKAHIKRRAKALGQSNLIPDDWKAGMPDDIQKFLGEEAWDASRAIDALNTVYALYQREAKEADPEQMASLQQVIDSLKTFIASEIAEKPDGDGDMAYAAKIDDLQKAVGTGKAELTDAMAKLDATTAEIAKMADEIKRLKATPAEIPLIYKSDLAIAKGEDVVNKRQSAIDDDIARVEKIADPAERTREMIKLTHKYGAI